MPLEFDADEWAVLVALFDEVLKLPADARPVWLAALGARDPARQRIVLRLLAADAGAADAAFLDSPAAVRAVADEESGIGRDDTPTEGRDSEPAHRGFSETPAIIGPYKLLRKIGEGGMGEVWLADQQTPVKRQVALKLIKAGMDTRQVIARFEAERQALAMMDHPTIAKVFDAGETSSGRPYFVMEYVKGEPITAYCDRQRSTTVERIRLFLQVCEGVQHAHQKGIIHRDLKPSNILVETRDGVALPRIIDFGVAKATARRLTEKTLVTELGAMIGTPEYMSPEQAELAGIDVDTRTDVYSLGVVLYELLVGALPFDSRVLRQAAFDEVRRVIREVEPPRPSVRATAPGADSIESAKNRRTEPGRLAGSLRGDLDWITMKALEKDRMRRYGSPSELAADLARHLAHLPVTAGPPDATYRARKFVRRHRFGVALAGVAVAALVVFAGSMALQSARIARERDRANREAATSNRALQVLTDLFTVSDPSEARGKTITAREILDRGAGKIETDLKDEPLIRATLYLTLGKVYRSLGLYDSAKPLLERSVALRRELLGPRNAETLDSIDLVASVLQDQGKLADAEPYFREALAGRRVVLGNDDPDTIDSVNNLGLVLKSEGKLADAEPYLREAMQANLKAHDDEATLMSMNNLGMLLEDQGKHEEADPILRDLVERCRRALGNDHPHTLSAIGNLAIVLQSEGNQDETERLEREVLETRRRVLGNDHPQTLHTMFNLGFTLRAQGKLDEAEGYCRAAFDGFHRTLGDDHPLTLLAQNGMGGVLQAQGKLGDAEAYYRQALAGRRRVLGEDHSDTIDSLVNVAAILKAEGRLDESGTFYRDAEERARRALGADHWRTLGAGSGLGDLYTSQGHLAEAQHKLEANLTAARRALPAGHRVTGRMLSAYGRCLTSLGRYADAEAALVEAQGILAKADAVSLPIVAKNFAELYTRWGKPEKAAEWRAKTNR